ncbi:sensor histidine kinase [Williamsia herbipolensis]|uniref:sensor histidine kinase n=1 Tax=Williamsia herbipolensis TaxID=1603258 RepID=UPI000AFA3D5F|nr:HAMP domain-containing sensor histidine kinase [Williamsia herbipolensis]
MTATSPSAWLRRIGGRRHPVDPDGIPTTPTPSLRRRVLVLVVLLFAVLLTLVGVAIDIALGHQLRSDLSARLTDRADRSTTLVSEGYSPQQLANALQGDAIRVRVTTSDGEVYGGPGPFPDAGAGDVPVPPSGRPGPGGRGDPGGRDAVDPSDGPPAPGVGPDRGPPRPPADSLVVTRRLPGGTTVTLLGDTTSIAEVRTQLRWLMLGAGAATLVVAAALMLLVVRRALRPLDAMVAVARGITSGDRGRRLRPRAPDTELGRAAGSVDEMLDALEAAETAQRAAADTARRAEADTKRFLADAAHELRTPIAGLSAVAESLRRDGTDRPDRIPRWTELLVRESQHASRLVADLLDMARIDSDPQLTLADTDLVEVVADVIDRWRLLGGPVTIRRTGAAAVPIRVDAGRIGQVVSNLVDNAVRAATDTARALVTVDVSVDGSTARITVTDSGPGVPPDARERIFDRLVQLDSARDSTGAGLGLPIARALARAHGGDVTHAIAGQEPITGESSQSSDSAGGGGGPGVGGATFVVTLPLATDAPRSVAEGDVRRTENP